MQNRYLKGQVSLLVSPGGSGKSKLGLVDAAAIATGKPLSGFDVMEKGPVWYYNMEDPIDEIQRRILAMSLCHQVPTPLLKDLLITSGRERPFSLCKADPKTGVVINHDQINIMAQHAKDNKIKLLICDPVVRTHEVNENDNMQMDRVVWAFQQIALKANCAIGLVHHTSKVGADPKQEAGDMHSSRGATAVLNAARIVYTMRTMTTKEAKKLNIPDPRKGWYIRLDSAKANMHPPANKAFWYELHNMTLPNTDEVGAIKVAPDMVVKGAQDIKDEVEDREFLELKNKVLKLLYKHMKPGDDKPLTKVIKTLQSTKPGREALGSDTDKSKLTLINKIKRIIGEAAQYEEKVFTLYQARKGATTVLKCRQNMAGKREHELEVFKEGNANNVVPKIQSDYDFLN